MQAKITDFGFALDEQDATTHGLVGTIHFLAPELALAYQDHKICVYTRKTDIFALGVTLFQMLLNEMPYQLEDGEMVSCSTIAKGQFRTIPTAKHPLVADFISRCIIQAPDARIETEVLSALSPYLLDVNDTTSEKTPLWFLAVKHRLTHFIRKLLNQTPELLNATDELNQTALLWSAGKGYDEIVSLLIMLHADVNIAAQIPSNHPEFENHNMSALDWAMQNEYCQSTLLLTQAGAIANKIDSFIKGTSLLRMMQNGSIEFIQMLINHNPVFLNQIDNKGHALLHYAAMCGQLDIMRDLIKKGAEVNIKDTRNQSPLLWAASKGHHEMVAFLITQGADINSSTRNSVSEHHNYTPLDWASLGKHTQTIAILKAAGAISNHQIVENKPDSVPNSHSFFKRPQSTESTTNDLPKKRSFES
jgi:ankyrin repeat protein